MVSCKGKIEINMFCEIQAFRKRLMTFYGGVPINGLIGLIAAYLVAICFQRILC